MAWNSDTFIKRTGLIALCAAIVLASACESTGGSSDDAGVGGDAQSGGDAASLPAGLVTFNAAGETVDTNFDQGDEQYLIVPFSPADVEATAIAYTVKVESPAGTQSTDLALTDVRQRLTMAQRNPALWARWQRRLAVERWTRAVAERAASVQLTRRPSGSVGRLEQAIVGADCALSSECGDGEVCAGGSCKTTVTIKVSEFASSAQTIEAEVRAKGQHVAILAEVGAEVTQADIDAFKTSFDETIYPRDVALFGDPPLEDGGTQLSSDRNADGLVWLVLTPKVAEKNDAVGFFVATDFIDVATESASNEADILYSVPPSASTTLDQMNRIMAHEFQHLLGFGSKVYRSQHNGGQGDLEDLWLDEGQSHFAEDACGFGGENVTLLDQELFPSFSQTSMIPQRDDMGQPIDTLAMRAMAMTFVRYLFEQKGGVSYDSAGKIADHGGAAWLAAVHTSSAKGVDAVNATYGDFGAAFERWITTIALDNRGVTDSPIVTYQPLVTDPITGNKIGLQIRGSRVDFTGATVNLEGPIEQEIAPGELNETIPKTTGMFYLLSGQQGTAKVTVTSDETSLRFAVIKLK